MSTFYENLAQITQIFDNWTPCERTVVLCALFRRVPWFNFKLLKNALESTLQQQISTQTEAIENEANDYSIISQTARITDDNEQVVDIRIKLMRLLVYLPLLEPTNERVKQVYLNSVPDIIQHCVDNNCYMYECKQYLSYMLIHPALNAEDRGSLAHWLRYLENHLAAMEILRRQGSQSPSNYGSAANSNLGSNSNLSNVCNGTNANVREENGNNENLNSNGSIPPNSGNCAFRRTIGKNLELRNDGKFTSEGLQESFSKNGKELDLSNENDTEPIVGKSQRSHSLTPAMPSHISSSAENLDVDEFFVQKPRSFSLSSEHMGQLKPLLATTGSESHLDAVRANHFVEHPGMSPVAQWLKSHRLHKYVWLFTNVSYEQMLAMDEEYLLKLGVTTGARHKLLLCISKLHNREALLDQMVSVLLNGPDPTDVVSLMEQLREVLMSPLPPQSRLCYQLVLILELASTCLIVGTKGMPKLPAFPAYNHHPDDRTFEHPVAGYDPLSMHCWLLDRALHHPAITCNPYYVDRLMRLRYRIPPMQFFSHVSDLPFTKRTTKPRWRSQGPPPKSHGPLPRLHIPPPKPLVLASKPQGKRPSGSWSVVPNKLSSGQSLELPTLKNSYASFPPFNNFNNYPLSPHDINLRLESLCLQMTEKAMTE